jgi:ATP-dependent Clp protease ATP-binding subunit ClpB
VGARTACLPCGGFGIARNTATTFDVFFWLQVTNFDVSLLHSAPDGPYHTHIVIFVLCLHGPNYFVATFALECPTDPINASIFGALGGNKLFRFDMSEYQTQESLGVLLGGRIGEVGLLGMPRAKSATGTLLFDEIEKAHPRVLDLFLQILDAARVTMASGETLDLSGFYIVFTSNIAAAEILNLQHSSFTTMERHVLAKAQQSLRPELYARITERLVFKRLSYDVQMEIARLHIGRELSFLRDKGFDLTVGHSVVSFLMQRGFHPRLGARPLRDTIEKHLRGAVADAVLAGVNARTLEFVVCENKLLLRPH